MSQKKKRPGNIIPTHSKAKRTKHVVEDPFPVDPITGKLPEITSWAYIGHGCGQLENEFFVEMARGEKRHLSQVGEVTNDLLSTSPDRIVTLQTMLHSRIWKNDRILYSCPSCHTDTQSIKVEPMTSTTFPSSKNLALCQQCQGLKKKHQELHQEQRKPHQSRDPLLHLPRQLSGNNHINSTTQMLNA